MHSLPILWLISMAGRAVSTEEIQISFSNTVIAQCDILNFEWTGGTPPFFTVPASLGNSETLETGISTFSYSWQVNFPAGTQVSIGVGDSFNDQGISGVFTVAASSDSSCLVGDTPTGATPATGGSQPTGSTLPSHSDSGGSDSDVPAIAGGAAGGAVGLIFVGLGLWYCCRRRKPNSIEPPTTTPGTLSGTAAPLAVTRGVSTKVLPEMGYQTEAYDPGKVQSSVGGTSPPPMMLHIAPAMPPAPSTYYSDESTIAEVPYEQKTKPMVVANPVPGQRPSPGPTMPVPNHQPWSSAGGVDRGTRMTTNGTRMTTNSDFKTVMSWGPPSSQAASSSASLITSSPREQELEQRLRMLESRVTSIDMAPPSYDEKD
ncbi:hypothetical protein K438DRAFT_1795202 [Mycena galopus ATCC 62051]|nr:hypothetical protein K438DRAFT_1795202 [Mycena galopus ATCC 62051]